LTDNSLQSADKDQQEMCAEKPHDAVVTFYTYQNLQQHRAVLPAIARLLLVYQITAVGVCSSLVTNPWETLQKSVCSYFVVDWSAPFTL